MAVFSAARCGNDKTEVSTFSPNIRSGGRRREPDGDG
jgi:hypothetical protein